MLQTDTYCTTRIIPSSATPDLDIFTILWADQFGWKMTK
jgi:hypothetical protein